MSIRVSTYTESCRQKGERGQGSEQKRLKETIEVIKIEIPEQTFEKEINKKR